MNLNVIQGRFTIYQLLSLAMVSLFLVASSVAFAPTASAAPVTVKGEVQCLNSAPVGVWVVGERSTSGWAKTRVPIKLGGHSKLAYEFKLNRGGRYAVHVGCGGGSQSWKVNAKSGWLSGTNNNVKCNDIDPLAKKPQEIVLRWILSQGVKYKTCAKV